MKLGLDVEMAGGKGGFFSRPSFDSCSFCCSLEATASEQIEILLGAIGILSTNFLPECVPER